MGEDFNNQSQPYTVSVGGGENMTADFGYNWTPAGNVTGNTGTGAIGDRVWVDADGDGLQDPGEPGLGGATVRLLTDDNGDGIYGGAGDNPAITTTTDAAGNYIFANLPAGSYSVEVDTSSLPSGYAQTGDPDATCPGGGCDNRTTQPLVLAPGDVYLNADFGYQPTGASGAIGNTVWFNPNGNSTVDAGEYGIPGVSVALIQDSNGNGVWDAGEPIIATDITDSNGQYNFTGLPLDDGDGDADYLVWVNDTDNVLGELIPNYDADGLNNPASGLETTGISAAAVSAVSPTNTNQNFGYGPEAIAPAEVGVIGDTIFLDRNGNGSFDPGEGLENVEIELLSNLGTLIETTRTDENGHYAFGGVADGTYTIRVVQSTLPNGGAGLTNSIDPDTSAPGNSESSVTLAAGNRINLDQDFGYIASNPGAISGTLWVDSNADGTLTESGRFEGVTIALLDADGDVIATTTTDNAGNYSFPGLPAGTYTVHVTDAANVLEGYWQSPDIAPGTDGNSQSDPYTITLAAGESNSTADFGYYREPASVSDFVWDDLDQDGIQDPGEPGLPGVIVTLTIVYPNGATVTLVDVTDSNGAYLFDNLLLDEGFDGAGAGEPTYTVTFAAPSGYFPSPINQGGDDADSDGTTVTVTPVEGQDDTTVDSGFYAVVRIGDRLWYDWDGDGEQDSNEPGMAGVVVELDNGACTVGVDCPTATTDANGNYSFTDLPSGDYTVLVRASSLPAGIVQTGDPDATLDGQHTLNATAPGVYLDVDFGYQGTGSISDFVWNDLDGDGVQDAGEGGIGGVTVWVDLNNDGVQNATEPSAITDANGQYLISGLPAGTYTVRTSGAPISGATATYDVDGGAVPAGTPNVATVSLSAGQNRTDVDWGYQFTALSISKTSSAGGAVNPGDTINYTIVVRNNTAARQTGIAITDALPAGTTYVAQSTVVSGYTNLTYLDQFETTAFNNSDGTASWTGASWVETNDDGIAGTGVIQINGTNTPGWARFNSNDTTTTYALTRPTNLANAIAATLSYTLREDGTNTAADTVRVRVSTDNGTTWATLTTVSGNFGTYNGSHDLVSPVNYAAAGTRIQFQVTGFDGTGVDLNVDNVQIAFTKLVTKDNIPSGSNPDLTNGAPPSLVVAGDGFILDPGQQMQATYRVTVNNPVQEASIDNTASVVSTQQPTPRYASTSDRLPPSALGDRVWLDRDADGIQDADEPGIGGVKVTLTLSYPGGNTETFATFTDAAGNYSFANLYLNEAFTTAGATFSLSFDAPPGASASPVAQGGNPAADSNGVATAPALFYQGRTDITYDSGFTTLRLDLGDLPDTYKTRFSPGPAHLVFPDTDADGLPNASGLRAAVWLGPTIDVELDGTPTPDATGDGADEDGLVIPANLMTGELNNFTVIVNASATGTRVYYGLWIDWDVTDGVFFKSEDFYSGFGVTASPTPVTVPVLVPFDYAGGTVYVRVRAADSELVFSDATGTLINGEVEDHYRDSIPTAVTLAAFSATVEGEAVRVTWETASELNNLGFNLYRSEAPAGPWVKLNAELIGAQNPGATFGATYWWLDTGVTPDTTYYYRLEDMDVSGTSTFHGPVSATVTGPTAVRIAEFGARGTAPAMLLLTLTTVAALAVQRKRRIAG